MAASPEASLEAHPSPAGDLLATDKGGSSASDQKTGEAGQQKGEDAKEAADSTAAERARINQSQGERTERMAHRILRNLGFERAGLSLHYGKQGIDVYGLRNTPHGMTWARMEVKSTRDPDIVPSEHTVRARLKIDKMGLQQGSRLYGQDRLEKAFEHGSPVARFILSRQARAGEGRMWQGRDYVCFVNTATGKYWVDRVFSNEAGNRLRSPRDG